MPSTSLTQSPLGRLVDRLKRIPRRPLVLAMGGLGALLLVFRLAAVLADVAGLQMSVPATLEVERPRVVILKSARMLHLFDGDALVRSYPISLGGSPIGQKIRAGDNRTPVGVFRVCTRNPNSKYHRFLGISYPDLAAAERGLQSGLISFGDYRSIIEALEQGKRPPWNTALGGAVGIHGEGGTARSADWTAGCIAVTDEAAEELFGVLRLGDEIEILP